MALYRRLGYVIMRQTRLCTSVAKKISRFQKLEDSPIMSNIVQMASPNNEQWKEARRNILESDSHMKSTMLDTMIFQYCIASQKLSLAKSYLNYLLESQSDLHVASVGKYLHLLYMFGNRLTESDKQSILHLYEKIMSKHSVLDSVTAEYCIEAISLTDKWEEFEKLLNMIKLCAQASSATYSAIVMAAFKNKKPDIGWKYLEEMMKLKRIPKVGVYQAYSTYCMETFPEAEVRFREISKIFQLIADHDLMINEAAVGHLQFVFAQLGWLAVSTTISAQGKCQNCGHQLKPLIQSEKDIENLKNVVLDKVLIGHNVYYRTTPKELSKFVKFVQKTKPYDVVVDGLNVGYKTQVPSQRGAEQLSMLVRYFLDKNQVVLILGRKHMMRWDPEHMNFVKRNAYIFLMDDLSQDDPCLLYAALASGSHTNFVSSDLMRQHKHFLADIQLQRTFKQWQMAHQILVRFNRNKLHLTLPLPYLPVAQGNNDCWHVPYRYSTEPQTQSYEAPRSWICLSRSKSKSESR